MRRALATFGAVGVAVAVTPGCFSTECESGKVEPYVGGEMLDGQTWESTSIGAGWLDFPAKKKWQITVPEWQKTGRVPDEMYAWISAAQQPNGTGDPDAGLLDNWTLASGNLAEFTLAQPGYIEVTNDTCSHWFLRVVLRSHGPASTADAQAGD